MSQAKALEKQGIAFGHTNWDTIIKYKNVNYYEDCWFLEIVKQEVEKNNNQIVETLNNYKIQIDNIKATIGPTVTLYEIIPDAGIRISKIKNLEDDIALSLSALGIRIIAPIPGKGTIGIEVPNKKKSIVSMKSLLSSKKFIEYLLHERLFRSILIGTIPIVLLGGSIKLFVPYFFDRFLRSNLSIALVSFLMAFFMYLADSSKRGSINIKNHNYSDSFLIGFSQAFAIIPGFSRSGVTISTALISGWERGDAAKFSFLLGMPAISLAAIVEFISSFKEFSSFSFPPLIVALTTTFISSLLAIDFLLKYFTSNGLKLFIIYRVVFGFVILLNL